MVGFICLGPVRIFGLQGVYISGPMTNEFWWSVLACKRIGGGTGLFRTRQNFWFARLAHYGPLDSFVSLGLEAHRHQVLFGRDLLESLVCKS